MPDGMTWKENLRNEKKKIKAMDGKQRLSYFKSYYLVKTLIALAVLIMAASMLHDFIMGGRQVLISGCMVNTSISEEGRIFLTEDYFDSCDGNPKKQMVQLATENYIDFTGEHPEMEGTARQMALFTQISAGDIDYLLVDETSLSHLAQMGLLTDLEQLLSPELVQQFGDACVSQKNEETGKTFVAGIDLAVFDFPESFKLQPKKAFLAFTCAQASKEKAERFLAYLLAK